MLGPGRTQKHGSLFICWTETAYCPPQDWRHARNRVSVKNVCQQFDDILDNKWRNDDPLSLDLQVCRKVPFSSSSNRQQADAFDGAGRRIFSSSWLVINAVHLTTCLSDVFPCNFSSGFSPPLNLCHVVRIPGLILWPFKHNESLKRKNWVSDLRVQL